MKKLISLVLSCLIIIGLVACSPAPTPAKTTAATTAPTAAPPSPTPSKPIKLGCVASLTGDKATQGEYAKNSAKIALEEINGAGGVLGRMVEVVFEDDLGTDAGGVNAFNKLASDDEIVAVVGPGYSTISLAMDADVEKAKILTTALGSNDKLGYLGNPWMYQMRTSDSVQVSAGTRYAVEKLGLKTWAIIHDTETASAGQAEVTIKTLAEYGITPKVVVSYTSGTQDFTSHLLQIQQADVEAVFGAGLAVEDALIMTQYRMMGIDAVFVGSNGYSSAQTISLAGEEVMNGVYSATHFVPETPLPKGKAYAEKYFKATGVIADAAGALVYDHIYLLTEAIKRAGNTDRTAVRDAFLTIQDYEGAVTVYSVKAEGSGGTGALVVQNDGKTKKILELITVK
ncbi:MAG: ABC transporter substrate-binding protein [Christensenellales bacterium]